MVLTIIAYIFVVVGLLITAINLPGIWVILVGILISAISGKFVEITPFWMLFMLFIALLSSFVDNIVVLLGAKRYGATKWGIIGAIVGMIVGFILGSLVGLILGPFIGAVLFEILFARKESSQALQAGVGTIVGMVASIFVKMGIAIFLIILWQILLR